MSAHVGGLHDEILECFVFRSEIPLLIAWVIQIQVHRRDRAKVRYRGRERSDTCCGSLLNGSGTSNQSSIGISIRELLHTDRRNEGRCESQIGDWIQE